MKILNFLTNFFENTTHKSEKYIIDEIIRQMSMLIGTGICSC